MRLSIPEKRKLAEDVENGMSHKEVAEKYGIQRNTVSSILKKKEDLMQEKKHKSKFDNLDDALFLWFWEKRHQGLTISGPLLLAKAQELASKTGQDKPTMGFVDKFKKRHSIVFKKMFGESGAADPADAVEWIKAHAPVFASYEKKDIFNMDETGVFFRALPHGTLCFSNENVKGNKAQKDRITVVVCANGDGSCSSLWAIGKSQNPRCFKTLKPCLPYKANKKAWMTRDLFNAWLLEFDKGRRDAKRNALLLLDNCPVHTVGEDINLTHTKVLMLPPNLTSVMQPMDMGVIKAMKSHYRSLLCAKMLNAVEGSQAELTKILKSAVSISDALILLKMAWSKVTAETIRNCWNKGIFNVLESDEGGEEQILSEESANEELLDALGLTTLDFDVYIDMDSCENGVATFTDEALLDVAQPPKAFSEEAETSSEEEEEPPQPPVSLSQAREACQIIKRFFAERNGLHEDHFKLNEVSAAVDRITLKSLKQSKIDDFFKASS